MPLNLRKGSAGWQILKGQHGRGVDDQLQPDDVDRQEQQRQSHQRNGGGADHQRQVDEQQVGKGQAQVLEQLPSFGHRIDDGPEVVVQQHHGSHLARAAGAARTHGHTDVRLTERRHIVDPVASHGHELALRLKCLNQHQLLGGGGARHHIDGRVLLEDLLRIVLGLHHHGGRGAAAQADGSGNGDGCGRMVSGDHDDTHARGHALCDRLTNAIANRVLEGQQTSEGEALGGLLRGWLTRFHGPVRTRDHLAPRAGVFVYPVKPAGLVLRRQAADRQHGFGCALGAGLQSPVGHGPDGRFPSPRFGEREAREQARLRHLAGPGVQGLIQWIATVGARRQLGDLQQAVIVQSVVGGKIRQHQFAGRDRARFVRDNAAGAADVFDGHGAPHQRVLARQAEHAHAQKEGVDHRKLFRDRGHRQGDRTEQGIDPAMSLPQTDGREHDANDQGGSQQHDHQFADRLLQGCRFVPPLGGRPDDFSVAGAAAREDDAKPGRAGQQPCAGGAPAVLRSHGGHMVRRRDRPLGDRQGFSRQGGFVHLQIAACHEDAIGREVLARPDLDQVARDQLPGSEVRPLAVSQHTGFAGQAAGQAGRRRRGSAMQVGVHAQQGQHCQHQRERLGQLSQPGKERGGQHQEPQHGIACGVARDVPPVACGLGNDVIEAERPLGCGDLIRGQALVHGDAVGDAILRDLALTHAIGRLSGSAGPASCRATALWLQPTP